MLDKLFQSGIKKVTPWTVLHLTSGDVTGLDWNVFGEIKKCLVLVFIGLGQPGGG